MSKDFLTIALPKGKLAADSVRLLACVGLDCREVEENSRKLLFDLPANDARIIICRPTDYPVYVEHGAADIGFVGRIQLLNRIAM